MTDRYLEASGLEESGIRRRFARARKAGLWLPEPPRSGYFSSPYALELASGLNAATIACIASGSAALRPEQVSGGALDLDADEAGSFSLSGSAVISWTDVIGGHVFDDQSTSSRRPTLESNAWATGKPSVLGDGTNDLLTCEDGLAAALIGGSDNTFCIAAVVQCVTVPVGYHVFLAFSNQTTTTQFVDFGRETSGGFEVWRIGRSDDVGAGGSIDWGTPNTNKYVFIYNFHGTTQHVYQNNVVVNGTAGGAGAPSDVGTITLDRATLFGRYRGAATIQGNENVRTRRIYAWSNDLTHQQAKGVGRYLMSANGV